MIIAAKAFWTVQAGLIPGDPIPEYNRHWSYTSVNYSQDGGVRGATFLQMQGEAQAYATELQQGGLNWVILNYVWL